MNNRFLFRGKRIDNGEWVYGYYVGSMGLDDSHEICDINDISGSRVEVDRITICQCTGLNAAKSYRGTEPENLLIYEGDIIRTSPFTETAIEWDARYFRWGLKGIGTLHDVNSSNIEIISTVFDESEVFYNVNHKQSDFERMT